MLSTVCEYAQLTELTMRYINISIFCQFSNFYECDLYSLSPFEYVDILLSVLFNTDDFNLECK